MIYTHACWSCDDIVLMKLYRHDFMDHPTHIVLSLESISVGDSATNDDTCNHGSQPNLKPKNRFKNVIPCAYEAHTGAIYLFIIENFISRLPHTMIESRICPSDYWLMKFDKVDSCLSWTSIRNGRMKTRYSYISIFRWFVKNTILKSIVYYDLSVNIECFTDPAWNCRGLQY